jgi:predicted TIM-barrel fold metal-dependent hydrolase
MFAELKDKKLGSSAVPRRQFLAGLGALGAAALIPEAGAAPQTVASPARPFRIDTHHHFTVPSLRAEITKAGQQGLLDWTPQKSLDDMDKGNVATAILSVGDPGLWFGDDQAARRLARECNEYSAKLIKDYPGRFGMFTALPLPDVEGSLRELEYGFDTLHADGVCVLSSYQGRYLGNALFAPLVNRL